MKKGDYIAVGHSIDDITHVRVFLRRPHTGVYVCVAFGQEEDYRVGNQYTEQTWDYAKELSEFSSVECEEHFEEGELVAVWNNDSINKIPGIFEGKSGSYYLISSTDGRPVYARHCEKVNDFKKHNWRVKK